MNQIQKFFSKPYWFYALILILMVLSGYLLFYDMHFGPWAFSDSAEYIISAKNLVEGNGLGIHSPSGNFMPLILHPPLYSLILAPFMALNLDILIVIKWLNIFLFAGSIFLLTFGIFRISQSFLFAIAVGILFLVSPAMLNNFNGAMSEPLFIFLSISNLILLNLFLKNGNKWYFWGAVVVASLATLTRYIGLTSIIMGVIFLFFCSERSWKRKIGISFGYGIITLIPITIWFLSNGIISGSMGARTVNLDISIVEALTVNRIAFTEILAKWLPFRTEWFPNWRSKVYTIYITVIIFGLLLISLVIAWWKRKFGYLKQPIALILSACFYMASYFGFLVASYLSSIPPDLNERMFSPLLIFIFIFMFGVLVTFIRVFKLPKFLHLIPVALVIILAISYWQQTRSIAIDRNTVEYSYSSPSWENSNLIREVKEITGRPILYSNHPTGVLIYTGFFPFDIYKLPEQLSQDSNDRELIVVLFYPISEEDQALIDDLKSKKAYENLLFVSTKEVSDGKILTIYFKK